MQDVEHTSLWARPDIAQLQAGAALIAVMVLDIVDGGPSWHLLACGVVAVLWARAGGLSKLHGARRLGSSHGAPRLAEPGVPSARASDTPEVAVDPPSKPLPDREPGPADTDFSQPLRSAAARGMTAADSMLDDVDVDLGRTQVLLAESVGDLNERFENLKECSSKQLGVVELLAEQIREPPSGAAGTKVTLGQYIKEADLALQEFVDNIVHVSHHSMAMAGRIEEITRQMDAIQEVTERAEKLAKQTSLLALNAKIEAARAGANARGFSVIADEVHGLAHESHEFNDQIGLMVNEARASVAATKVAISELASQDMSKAVAARARLESMANEVQQINVGIAASFEAVSGYANSVSDDVGAVVRMLQFEDIVTQIISRSRNLLGGGQAYFKGSIPVLETSGGDIESRAVCVRELNCSASLFEAHLAETNDPAQQNTMGQGDIELF